MLIQLHTPTVQPKCSYVTQLRFQDVQTTQSLSAVYTRNLYLRMFGFKAFSCSFSFLVQFKYTANS